MKELGLDIKVQSVLCDFELNILKACDTMLKVLVCGCFFSTSRLVSRGELTEMD